MNANEFCTLASALTMPNTGQASWRSAISRAYYSLFHGVLGLVQASGFRISDKHGAHKKLEDILIATESELKTANSEESDFFLLADVYREMRKSRQEADYKMELDPIKNHHQAAAYVSRTRRSLSIINTVKSNQDLLDRIHKVCLDARASRTLSGTDTRPQTKPNP